MLDNIIKDNNFFTPYIKQFLRILDNNIILNYVSNGTIIDNCLKNLDCNFDNKDNLKHDLYNGIIISNVDNELSNDLFQKLYDLLFDNGYIFVILHTKKVNKIYDEEEELEEVKYLLELSKNLFIYEKEFVGDSSWKFIIFKKNTIK